MGDVIHSFHLAVLPPLVTARTLIRPPRSARVEGLDHAECLALMRLGAPTITPERLQLRRLAMFAQWQDERALDRFLAEDALGQLLSSGWHVRLQYLRRWSKLAALPDLPARAGDWDDDEPVVAITVARMRLPELPRFLRYAKPVERLVRDHPGTTLAGASLRPPRDICTFSIWRSVREMEAMVHGHSAVADPTRHADAMVERQRRDFHHEFATFRFRPLSEHGEWEGRGDYVPSPSGTR